MEFETPTEEALELWQQLIGIRAEDRPTTLGSWEMHDTLKALQEAFEIDTSEITATLLLRHFLKAFKANTKFSLRALIETPDLVEISVAKTNRLTELLTRPEVEEQTEAFMQAIQDGLTHYGAFDREEVQKLVASPETLGILRRDALRSIQKLKVDQFFDGQPEETSAKPVYHTMVHQWWNINSMLEAAFHLPSGVSLNLIRDHNDYHSFFCFLIKNGHNIFVLSDVPQWAHPLQGSMSRRPERTMGDRIEKNHFPYDLMNVGYDEKGGVIFGDSDSTALVLHQEEALAVRPIAELPPVELVWTLMMFDLIIGQFWKKGYKAPALSYTGEMVKVQDKLELAAHKAGLPVIGYQPIEAAPLTVTDVANATEKDGIGKQVHRTNRWMEERYGARVSEVSLNMVASPEKMLLLTSDQGIREYGSKELKALGHWDREDLKKSKKRLTSLDATSFGTRDNLLANRAFIARVNYARQIHAMAKEEYERRKGEIEAWYIKAVRKNRNAILAMAGYGPIWFDTSGDGQGSYRRNVGPQISNSFSNQLEPAGVTGVRGFTRLVSAKPKSHYDPSMAFTHNIDPVPTKAFRVCALTGTKPTFGVVFYPANANDLAVLTGVSVGELPDVLQHFDLRDPYSGNSILDRIDPMEWMEISNPWTEMNFQLSVPLSKRGLSKIASMANIPEALRERVVANIPDKVNKHAWHPEKILTPELFEE